MSASNQVAVVGYAHSPIERHANRPLGAIALDVTKQAIADAGLQASQVDGFTSGSMFPSAGAHGAEDGIQMVSSAWLAQHLGLSPRYVAGFQGYGQITGGFSLGVNAVASGAADSVVVHRALHNPPGRYHANPLAEARGSQQWTAPQGFFGPLATIALAYNEYLQRFSASRESTARIAVEARKNGSRIPWSYWYERPLTVEEYMAARQICEPICLFDCDIPVDGVAAFVLTTAERARDLPNQPVYIAGYAGAPAVPRRLHGLWALDDMIEMGAETARRLYDSAGFGPSEIDIPQAYDGFSPFVFFWLEALGLCPLGEAHRLIDDGGIDSDTPGAIPIISGGGAIGNGRMHGVPQVLECYLQLAGRAGARQRRDASIGVACYGAPNNGGTIAFSAEAY